MLTCVIHYVRPCAADCHHQVLELAIGGDLNQSLLRSPQKRLPEARVRFYAAEIVIALAYLHQLGLVYRDLKPQNVLLGEDGHIRLVDLGEQQHLIQHVPAFRFHSHELGVCVLLLLMVCCRRRHG